METMRDFFWKLVYKEMKSENDIIVVTADFGSPALDAIRERFPERFVNAGISEQNAINLSLGLALEGFTVFVYGISPFITMRCYEQIRTACITSHMKNLKINIVGVGAGASYSLSGPSHFAFEDIMIMNILGIDVVSPSDNFLVETTFEKCFERGIRYFRFDSKPLPVLKGGKLFKSAGFRIFKGDSRKFCITTGYLTHAILKRKKLSVIDLFLLTDFDEHVLNQFLDNAEKVFVAFECFLGSIFSKLLKFNSRVEVLEMQVEKVWNSYSREKIISTVLERIRDD